MANCTDCKAMKKKKLQTFCDECYIPWGLTDVGISDFSWGLTNVRISDIS